MVRRRVIEEQVMIPVPRSSLMVAAPPATVTQKSSLAVFGVPPRAYLRLVAKGAFPVKVEGKLRVAKFADVERYLTTGTVTRAPQPPDNDHQPPKGPPPGGAGAALRKLGYRIP